MGQICNSISRMKEIVVNKNQKNRFNKRVLCDIKKSQMVEQLFI